MRRGTVYTETVVHAAPERFQSEAPYQIAIVDVIADQAVDASHHGDGGRTTVRVRGARVAIGDTVIEVESVSGIAFFEKYETR